MDLAVGILQVVSGGNGVTLTWLFGIGSNPGIRRLVVEDAGRFIVCIEMWRGNGKEWT